MNINFKLILFIIQKINWINTNYLLKQQKMGYVKFSSENIVHDEIYKINQDKYYFQE